VLPVLQDDDAANFQLTADGAQPDAGTADVKSMNEFRIGFAGTIIAGNSDGQYRFGSIDTTLFTHARFFGQGCQSLIRRGQCHVFDLLLVEIQVRNLREVELVADCKHLPAYTRFTP